WPPAASPRSPTPACPGRRPSRAASRRRCGCAARSAWPRSRSSRCSCAAPTSLRPPRFRPTRRSPPPTDLRGGPMTLTGTTALVTGASRGFGRAIAAALHEAGADVVGVARDPERLHALHAELGGSLTTEAADVADPVV